MLAQCNCLLQKSLMLNNTPLRPATTGDSEDFVPDSILIIYASTGIRNKQMTAMIANHNFFASIFLLFFNKFIIIFQQMT